MTFDKVRIRFRKDGDLRLVSHHDLMRAFERMLRRAALPFRSTEGFHPQPRLIFALSLPLGVEGWAEVVEIEWTESVEPDDALTRLNLQTPIGITFLSAKRVVLKASAKARRAVYRLAIPATEMADLPARCAEVAMAAELWVERERPTPRQNNIKPYLNALKCGPDYLEIDLWVTQDGSARADELVRVLGLTPLVDAGAVLARTFLEIVDEIDPAEAGPGPVLPSKEERAAMVRPSKIPATKPDLRPAAMASHWGASPNGPIVE